MEFENWYNDPFNINQIYTIKKVDGIDHRIYKYNKLRCAVAKDGRKQKSCNYYFRNRNTHKCLFLMCQNECIAGEGND